MINPVAALAAGIHPMIATKVNIFSLVFVIKSPVRKMMIGELRTYTSVISPRLIFLGFDIPKFSFVSLHDFLQLFPIHSRSFHRVWLPVALWFKEYGS